MGCGGFICDGFVPGSGGGGGGGSLVRWQEEGVTVLSSNTANFVGAGVTVTNVAGVATITIPGATAIYAAPVPEQWCQNNVAASQTSVGLSAQVSTNFDTIKMIRAGSVVGLSTRLTEAIAAGQLTVEVTKNGAAFAAPFTLVHTSGSNASGGVAIATPGVNTYVASDVLAVRLTTNAGFLPITTDLEAWIEVVEAI